MGYLMMPQAIHKWDFICTIIKLNVERIKGNAHVNFSKPIAENVLGQNSAICEATDPIFWVVCPLGGYF